MNLLELSLFFYVGSMAFALIDGGTRRRSPYLFSLGLAVAGFAVQTLLGAGLWMARGVPPVLNLHQIFPVTGWAVVALYWVLFPLYKSRRILLYFLMPLVTACFFFGLIIPDKPVPMKPFFTTPWFSIHIFLLLFGIAFFFHSFFYATIFIMQDHSLRRRRAPSPLPIPSLEEAERLSTRLLILGYPLFTLGILSSVAYGIRYGNQSDWRPGVLEVASVVAWIVLGVAIFGWISARVHPRRRSWLVVAGAAFSILMILGILWH